MRVTRVFALLDQLRGRLRPVAAEVLAQALGVSVRTIYRDMAMLQAMGAPVRGEPGMGYQLEKGYFLPPLQFGPNELEALMLGLRLVMARGDPEMADSARQVAAKVSSVLPAEERDPFLRLPLQAFSRAAEERAGEGQWLALLRGAIRQRAVLRIRYRDLEGRLSEREVRPLGLTIFDTVWLLTAWCELRDDFRNFRVERLVSVVPAGTVFRHEKGKRFEDYLSALKGSGE